MDKKAKKEVSGDIPQHKRLAMGQAVTGADAAKGAKTKA